MLPTLEHGITPRRLSVGALIPRSDLTAYEPLRIVERHSAGRAPVVALARAARAVRPAVFVHRQGVVQIGSLMFRTSAIEVDAIIHLTD